MNAVCIILLQKTSSQIALEVTNRWKGIAHCHCQSLFNNFPTKDISSWLFKNGNLLIADQGELRTPFGLPRRLVSEEKAVSMEPYRTTCMNRSFSMNPQHRTAAIDKYLLFI
uniref:Uncharacterized protein n=2 Tax=Haemonchus contortus TaxID=6289 RepID=W6NI06_HAECO